MKPQKDISAEIEEAKNSPIDYSDIPPMTEEQRETARLYYKDFLDMLPPDIVKAMIKQRIEAAKIPVTAGN